MKFTVWMVLLLIALVVVACVLYKRRGYCVRNGCVWIAVILAVPCVPFLVYLLLEYLHKKGCLGMDQMQAFSLKPENWLTYFAGYFTFIGTFSLALSNWLISKLERDIKYMPFAKKGEELKGVIDEDLVDIGTNYCVLRLLGNKAGQNERAKLEFTSTKSDANEIMKYIFKEFKWEIAGADYVFKAISQKKISATMGTANSVVLTAIIEYEPSSKFAQEYRKLYSTPPEAAYKSSKLIFGLQTDTLAKKRIDNKICMRVIKKSNTQLETDRFMRT